MKRKASASPRATSAVFANASAALAPLRARWNALSPRERYLSSLAASAVGILLVWAIFLAPALRTLQKVQAQRLELDARLQQMLALQAEARQLAAQPRIGRDAAVRALQESVTALGSGAQLQVSGERAVLTLKGVPAVSVATWLGAARTNARVAPVEVRLVRSPARASAGGNSASARPAMPAMNPQFNPQGDGPGQPPSAPPQAAMAAPATPAARAPANDDVRWDGTLVLALPAP